MTAALLPSDVVSAAVKIIVKDRPIALPFAAAARRFGVSARTFLRWLDLDSRDGAPPNWVLRLPNGRLAVDVEKFLERCRAAYVQGAGA